MPAQSFQQVASSLASQRVLLYTVFSVGAVAAVIANALKNHSNFYSVAVYLSKSNGSVVVLANFAVLIALMCGRLLQQLFFGPLRPMEIERLYDRMWFFVTESLLAFTIFRDEFDVPFALMFGLLLFTKCFHWLLSDRIEWMDQRPYPGPPMLFHIRINALMTLLWISDAVMFLLAIENMMSNGVGGIVLFASEYAILLASLVNSVAKYSISMLDLRRASVRGGENAPPWEDKSMWIFYVELVTDFLKLVTYLTFFMVVLTFYGLPLNIIRDVYITARSFIMRLRDLIRYRTATRNMDQRYPNVTEAEMNAMSDKTCIICREEMMLHPTSTENTGQAPAEPNQQAQPAAPAPAPPEGPNTTPKKLPCGHFFHFNCLRSWLERQQSCPTCRRSVLDTQPPANAARAGAQAPPQPQPGAFAQFGLGAPRQQQQQQQQQGQPAAGAGNLGGIFGRVLGAAGMPPLVPGQFAPGLPPPPPPPQFGQAGAPPPANGHAGAWHGPQQYPPPPNQYGYPYRPQPPLFAPEPQQFQGFWGPDGVWQAWPVGAERNGHEHAEGRTGPAPPSSASSSNLPLPSQQQPDSTSAPNAATQLPAPPASDNAAVRPSPPAEGEGSSTAVDARARAAEAALRRLNSGRSVANRPGAVGASGESKRPGDGARGATADAASASSGTTPEPSATTNGAGPSRASLPALIPLYDPSAALPPSYRPSFPGQYPSSSSSVHRAALNPGTGHPRQHAPTPQWTSTSPFSSAQPSATRTASGGRVLRTLPPALTEEQLALLDRVTREAIDERLRILEGVQTVTARCVEDLLRTRSVLPRSNAGNSAPLRREAGEAAQTPSSSEATEEATSNTAETAGASTPQQVSLDNQGPQD